jgi:hypothetical protein
MSDALKTLVIHIGSHKTGTTTLQKWLFDNPNFLAEHGVSYVTAPHKRNMHTAVGFVQAGKIVPQGWHVTRPNILVQQLIDAPEQTVIASSENFSFFFEKRAVSGLHELVKNHFEQIQIVVYLRRQDSHAVSHYQEGAKPNRGAEEQLFGHSLSALPAANKNLDLYLDYERRIGSWLDVFGPENVTVRIFEPAKLVGGDVVTDFLDAVGVQASNLPSVEKKNVSMGFSAVTVGHMMNARQLPNPLKHRILNQIPPEETMLPSMDEARAFYEKYRESNIRLSARLGHTHNADMFSDDFSKYPQEGRGSWTDDKSELIIGLLLDQLKKNEGIRQVDVIRDAAIEAHKAGHGDRALKLIECAAELRPSGTYIQDLLKVYTKQYGRDT